MRRLTSWIRKFTPSGLDISLVQLSLALDPALSRGEGWPPPKLDYVWDHVRAEVSDIQLTTICREYKTGNGGVLESEIGEHHHVKSGHCSLRPSSLEKPFVGRLHDGRPLGALDTQDAAAR